VAQGIFPELKTQYRKKKKKVQKKKMSTETDKSATNLVFELQQI
jgi:hypothetical protein